METVTLVKNVVGLFVGLGVGRMAGQIIRNNVVPRTGFEKFTFALGTFVIGGMVARAAVAETDRQIDGFVDSWREAKKKLKEKAV